MRIALVTSMKYGLTQFIYRDVEALLGKGHDVRLLSLIGRSGLYNPPPDWNVVVASKPGAVLGWLRLLFAEPRTCVALTAHALRFRSLPDLAVAAQLRLHAAECEVIFSYFGDHKLFVAYYLKRMTGRPLAVTIRAYELHRNPNPRLFVEALAACDSVLTITEFNKQLLVERYGVPEERIEVIRQILDLDTFRAEPKVKVLIVGYFAEKKGHDVLLEAIRKLDRDDVEVWVVGDRNPSVLASDPRRLAEEMGLEDRVAFFGAQNGVALRALYRECDVFCLPSRTDSMGDKEGFPNVIAEAMAFGKPVVSTHHAGIPEAIDEILVDEGDPDQLAAALAKVIDSPELRQEMGRRNRERVEELFSPENNDRLERALLALSADRGADVWERA